MKTRNDEIDREGVTLTKRIREDRKEEGAHLIRHSDHTNRPDKENWKDTGIRR